ncbi:MAG: hypothetical protein M3303_16130 [Gemmatimonadota bacterium]|nr:hypothetical protein [Gemmatimonadota bacterium]
MTAPATLSFIPDIVEEHYDELQFLWNKRRNALRSAAYRERELSALEERIDAHAQGLLVIGGRIVDVVVAGLAGDDEMPAFAAATALLRLGTPEALTRVAHAFENAHGKKLDGLRDALAHGPSTPLTPQLTTLFLSAPPPVGAAAGEILAFHAATTPIAQHLERFMRAEEPATRTRGWRIAAYCGVSIPVEWYQSAFRDDEPGVKGAALTAAAWNASPTFLPFCRALASEPAPEAIEPLAMFASIAPPDDYELIAAVATNPAAGPDRFRVVGSFAHPYFIDLLIKEMENPDPAAAASAGTAFFKMTGRDVESDKRVKVSPDGKPPADDFEAEFQDEVFLPDPELARKHWQELAPTLARPPRICRGMDVSQPLSREQFAALDMESRYEYCLRMRLFSGWQGTPLVLERYPQRF